MLKIAVLYGSYRRHRKGIRAARFVERSLAERGHDVTLVDARQAGLPMLDLMAKEYEHDEMPETMRELAELFADADAFVIVTGEYNHGVQPGLKNLMDHFLESYFYRPSAIVSYSRSIFGGVRAATQWRAILAEMGMPSIPTIHSIPSIAEALDEDGEPLSNQQPEFFESFAQELEWYAAALREARRSDPPADFQPLARAAG